MPPHEHSLGEKLFGNGSRLPMLGLKGLIGAIANISAVGLIAVMFYQSQQESVQQNREDRKMFREELQTLHADSMKKWEVLNQLSGNQTELARLIRQLDNELRRGKSGRGPELIPAPQPKNKD